MGVNKIILNDKVLIDLSNDSATENDVLRGKSFHKADGSRVVGKHDYSRLLQEKAVTENGIVGADEGFIGLKQVNVNVPIPDGYIKPDGTQDITENGIHNIAEFEEISVSVQPNLQSKAITKNGIITPDEGYDGFREIIVAVSEFGNEDDYYNGEIITI